MEALVSILGIVLVIIAFGTLHIVKRAEKEVRIKQVSESELVAQWIIDHNYDKNEHETLH